MNAHPSDCRPLIPSATAALTPNAHLTTNSACIARLHRTLLRITCHLVRWPKGYCHTLQHSAKQALQTFNKLKRLGVPFCIFFASVYDASLFASYPLRNFALTVFSTVLFQCGSEFSSDSYQLTLSSLPSNPITAYPKTIELQLPDSTTVCHIDICIITSAGTDEKISAVNFNKNYA